MNSKFKELEESLQSQEFQTKIQDETSRQQQNNSNEAVEGTLDGVEVATDLVSSETLSAVGDALLGAAEVAGDVAGAAVEVVGSILSGLS